MGLSSAFVQIILLGLVAFTCPGLFNALSGLGAAGNSDPKYANQANCALYACFALFGYFGGVFFNLFGNRALLCAGGLTYAIYAAGMYLAGNYKDAEWLCIPVGCLLGIGAGLFWTAQGAMMMSYSTPLNKGSYIGYFWIIFNMGGLFGGLLQFGLNFNNDDNESQANHASYFIFIGLMALGAISVPFMIVKAEKVKKADGTMVEFGKSSNWMTEIAGAVKASLNPYMLLLALFFVASNWFYTYQFNFVNGKLFNIRTRGLNSAFYWASQMVSAYLIGLLLDWSTMTRRQRALLGWVYTFVWFVIAWSFGTYVQYGFEDGYDKDRPILNLVDFREGSRCTVIMISYILYGMSDAALQAFAYWLMGAIAGTNTQQSARFAGFYKGIQSAGAAIAWGLDLRDKVTYRDQYWTGFTIWAVGSALAYVAVRAVRNEDEITIPAAPVIQTIPSGGYPAIAEQLINHSTSMKEQRLNEAIARGNHQISLQPRRRTRATPV